MAIKLVSSPLNSIVMIKIFSIIICSVLALNLCAQTKYETRKWIEEKINLYGKDVTLDAYSGGVYPIVNSSAVVATIECEFLDKNSKGTKLQYSASIDIDDIINFSTEKSRHPILPNNIRVKSHGNKVKYVNHNGAIEYQSYLVIALDWSAEPDLYERFKKALRKIIEYNTENLPKETF